MEKIIVLNNKMNGLYNEVNEYIDNLNKLKYSSIVVLPSVLYIDRFLHKAKYPIGIQNIDCNTIGYNTGSISLKQVLSMNIEYVLVGHSELNEPYEVSNQKIKWIMESKLIPIVCLGEREPIMPNETFEKILCKIEKLFYNINVTNKIIIAYEPYWAVGSGNVPEIKQIENVVKYIKKIIFEKYKIKLKVLYGGSIDKDNINNVFNIKDLDGIMIGNNSFHIDSINQIINRIN